MTTPARGTQLLVGHMGWLLRRPALVALEVGWRWLFGLPLLMVCAGVVRRVLRAAPLEAAGLGSLDLQNPWLAAVQLSNAWAVYAPLLRAALGWIVPAAVLVWIVFSAVGRALILRRMEPGVRFRPFAMMALHAVWLALLAAVCWAWFRSVAWAATIYISAGGEPDLVGYAAWVIFFSLFYFVVWAVCNWPLAVAPLLMGIVRLALMVLAMVLSAAPLPFSDELGPEAMHGVWLVAAVFYLIASDFFQVMRLKSFIEFWRLFRGELSRTASR
jgi:hypothetical protein